VFSSVWNLPEPSFARGSIATRLLFSNWQVSGIVTAMSGLPVDIFDPTGGLLYGLFGARPNWAPAGSAKTAKRSAPVGYYFNPSAFSHAMVQPGESILSVHDPTAIVDPAAEAGTDIGNVGRNGLRALNQSNSNLYVVKRFSLTESKSI